MQNRTLVYIGTYTEKILFGSGHILDGKGEGVYLLELDTTTGTLSLINVSKNITNPSYLVVDKNKEYLYAVNELKEFQGKASGAVSAFKISPENGALSFINQQATMGTDPCFVELSPDGSSLYVANFMSGSVSVFPVFDDGAIGEMSQFIQHEGSSADPARQTGPHAHSVVFSKDARFAFVPDLGIDKLMAYETGQGSQPLAEGPKPFFETSRGAGPRHCVFSEDGAYCYLINELDCTIITLKYHPHEGSFEELQCVSTLPEGTVHPGNSCADIQITPDGRFLYGSNRGHNSLVIYRINHENGLLQYVGCQPCGGAIPRSFAIEPAGKYLLCANQDSNNIVVLEIDPASGALNEKSQLQVPTPVCVKPFVF